MTRNPNDKSKDPPGGRALERLRQFEDARRPVDVTPGGSKQKARKEPRRKPGETSNRSSTGAKNHEEQD